MRKIEDFLNGQFDLKEGSKEVYVNAVLAFERLAQASFEDVYLDGEVVLRVLSGLAGELSPITWNSYLSKYKRLAKWLADGDDEVCPKLWRKVKPKRIDWEEKLKDKWLTQEEFMHLLEVTDHPRDKAMFGVAVEGALRVGELLGLKIKDCKLASYGFDITVTGKIGTTTFPVVLFAPLLRNWLNHHPARHNPESPLWIRRQRGKYGSMFKGIEKDVVNEALKKYARRAGILKPISSHYLRHTKITWTYQNKRVRVSDDLARKMFRWSKNSAMPARYSHLTGADSKDTFLALAGVEEAQAKAEVPSIFKPRKCFGCGELNSAEALYCSRCGIILDEEEAQRILKRQKLIDYLVKLHMEEGKGTP
jgi:integrase